ncbi:MAG: hypothetical protein HRJ53_06765 [Acidobacteria bacterium Pan2503]|uniref:Uncharacterized protein n=1 Tax=Candidatus Acidiferrum panamense TaxID=2741543 RepID=A0A7V8NNS5_9BACT|nr:hypothetical protein [Candidatus Acidoferrum panamensis]
MSDNPVITVEQARAITRGRTPLVPVEYEAACKALAACRSIDDAKVWSDKADALAAWAKIYHDDKIEREAKMLKLHAYRQMAALAKEVKKSNGTAPVASLQAHGLPKWKADEVMAVGRATPEKYAAAIRQPNPPAPSFFKRYAGDETANFQHALQVLYRICLREDATNLATLVPAKDHPSLQRVVTTISEWLDEFEQRL